MFLPLGFKLCKSSNCVVYSYIPNALHSICHMIGFQEIYVEQMNNIYNGWEDEFLIR